MCVILCSTDPNWYRQHLLSLEQNMVDSYLMRFWKCCATGTLGKIRTGSNKTCWNEWKKAVRVKTAYIWTHSVYIFVHFENMEHNRAYKERCFRLYHTIEMNSPSKYKWKATTKVLVTKTCFTIRLLKNAANLTLKG